MASYSPVVQSAVSRMTEEQILSFESAYKRKKANMVVFLLLAIFFPIQLFFLGKVAQGILFLVTAGGVGIWWILEIFLTPVRVKNYNNDVAVNLVAQVKGSE